MPCSLPVMLALEEYTCFWYSVKLAILLVAYLRAANKAPRLLVSFRTAGVPSLRSLQGVSQRGTPIGLVRPFMRLFDLYAWS